MQQTKKPTFIPMLIIGALFFIFGFITWLNGTLIPYFKIACELNTFESLLVAGAFYISYFVMALPSSWILKKTGFKKGDDAWANCNGGRCLGVYPCCPVTDVWDFSDRVVYYRYRSFDTANSFQSVCYHSWPVGKRCKKDQHYGYLQ